ncbi:MAG: GSCFA domain-containing protein, partial [Acidocella sp.]|nr:GSCFA domain-containing protein [Acidocella sp.]
MKIIETDYTIKRQDAMSGSEFIKPSAAAEMQASEIQFNGSLTVHLSGIGDIKNTVSLSGGFPSDPSHMIEGFCVEMDPGCSYQFEYMAVTNENIPSGWARNGIFVGSRGLDGRIIGFAARMISNHEPPLECLCIGQFVGSEDLIEAVDSELCESPDKSPLLSMKIIIREAVSYKARALKNHAVVFGHSHAKIIKNAQEKSRDFSLTLDCNVIEMIGKYSPFSKFENGSEVYHQEFLADLEKTVRDHRPSILVALMSGLEIMITIRAYSIKPFYVLGDNAEIEQSTLSSYPQDKELLPASAIYLDYVELMRPWIKALPMVRRRFNLPVIMLSPPPPISDDESYIRYMPEEIRLDMRRSMPPSVTRYRVWTIWMQAVKDLCVEYGVVFFPPPETTIDSKDGGLALLYHGDGLHANEHYGAAQIKMVETYLAGNYTPPEVNAFSKKNNKNSNPYSSLPSENFWRSSISDRAMSSVDPVAKAKFKITKNDKIATAGSCFAQHIARHLKSSGFTYYVSELPHPVIPQNIAEQMGYGMFTARYGNIYTARQWHQLLERAYGIFEPIDDVWQHGSGFVDAFRPRIEIKPLYSEAEVRLLRESHFKAVRQAVENADYFIFTLGLTECWISKLDGAVYPICPGVAGGVFDNTRYEFDNFTVSEVVADLQACYTFLRA